MIIKIQYLQMLVGDCKNIMVDLYILFDIQFVLWNSVKKSFQYVIDLMAKRCIKIYNFFYLGLR